MSSRPIPSNRIETMFWSCDGVAPAWFTLDTEAKPTRRLPSLELAMEWAERHRARGFEIPRIVAPGPGGVMYWIRNGNEVIALNAFGNPDFATMMVIID